MFPFVDARGLPPRWLIGEANFAGESAAVWGASWVSVARSEDLRDAGDYVATQIGAEPVVVARDRNGELRGLSNVCPHRGSVIMTGSGNTAALQCPYHAWTFRLDGRLSAAPQMPGLDLDLHCLPRLAVEEWQGWVFVNIDGTAAPLEHQLAELTKRVEPYRLGELRRVGRLESEVACNWKLAVENFAESYHHAAVHPQTLQRDFPGQRSEPQTGGSAPWMWLEHESTNPDVEPFAVVLAYPSHMFTIVRGYGMDWLRLEALGPERTRLVTELFLPEELSENERLVTGLFEMTANVNAEDARCLERVAAGLRSRFAAAGPVSPLEAGCDHFRRWLRSRLPD